MSVTDALKRISDLESSVLYLENRNSALETKFEKSLKISEHISNKFELYESRLKLENGEKETTEDRANPTDELKNLKQMFLEVLNNCENFECRVSLLELKLKDSVDNIRILNHGHQNTEEKMTKTEKKVSTLEIDCKECSEKESNSRIFVEDMIRKAEDKISIVMEELQKVNGVVNNFNSNPKQFQSKSTVPQEHKGSPVRLIPSMYPLYPPPLQVCPQPHQILQFQPNFYQQYPTNLPVNIKPCVSYPLPVQPVQMPKEPTKSAFPLVQQDIHVSVDMVKDEDSSVLIGREGKTINRIREESGATIIIKEKISSPSVKCFEIVYKGTKEQIAKAKSLVVNVPKLDVRNIENMDKKTVFTKEENNTYCSTVEHKKKMI